MNKKLLAIGLMLVAILVAIFFLSKTKYENFILMDEQGKNLAVDFPFIAKSPKDNEHCVYELKGKMYLRIFSPKSIRIIVDDKILSLTINEKEVSLVSISEKQKSDWRNGFIIDLSEYLHSGENSIEIKFEDYGGNMAVKIRSSITALYLFSFLFLLFLLFILSKKMQLPKRYTFILFLAIAIRILYLSATDFDVREHDVHRHLEYTKYFVENWSLPPIEKATGGAFFHPPFYYFSTALLYSGVSYLTNHNIDSIYFSLQIFSLLTAMGFVYYGIKTARLIFSYFIKKDSQLLQKILPWVCCLLIVLWPSGILHSTRIGNDPLLYFLFTAALYFWINLYLQGKNKYLYIATLFTAAAILTKLNGALLIPFVIVLFPLKMIFGHIVFSKKVIINSILASLIIVAALGFAMYPGIMLKMEGKKEHVYMTSLYAPQTVGNNVENILWLDLKTFINEPFVSSYNDKYGRQYFPNYLGKTSLIGEWSYKGVAMHNIAVAISIVALAMFVVFIIFLSKMPIKDVKLLLPILLVSFFLLAGITHTRITFPVNIDFRYILPIIIPFSIFYNYGINLSLINGKKRIAVSAILLELLFCLLSVLFIVEILKNPFGSSLI